MDFSSDEYFGTLGQGLMKDLLADLQVEDGDWSLDQLEQELAQLDQDPSQPGQSHLQPLPPMDAASLVVQHAQGRTPAGAGLESSTAPLDVASDTMDAWSLSLKYTALSLQDDFLAADSVRKQQQQPATPTPQFPNSNLEGAEEYDIAEKPALDPPPGLGGAAVPPEPQALPKPQAFPKTPQNSLVVMEEEQRRALPSMPQSAPPNRDAPAKNATAATPREAQPPPLAQAAAPIPLQSVPEQMRQHYHHPGQNQAQGGIVKGIPNVAPAGLPMPPHAAYPMGPLQGAQGQPVVLAMPAGGPAWQAPPRAAVPPPIKAFCNPHPNAPPIPATALETKFMSSRDIAYVVHAILKPVLAEGTSEYDYHMQFLRRSGARANPKNPKHAKDMEEEMVSRAAKSKEWSSEKAVLGHVAKSNVARPRALIATPHGVSNEQQDMEQKQRASLWKARVYCDQAYQAYQIIVEIWRAAPPGGVPPQVQSHLVKLMKCMGITHVDNECKVDFEALKLLAKLAKGRTLIARVLEQPLLPPVAQQALLPVLLQVLFQTTSKKGEQSSEMATERLFRAITGVFKRSSTSSDTLLKCMESVTAAGKVALCSPSRMECVHSLLQKGSIVIGQDPSAENRAAWGKAESEFMNLL
eukprot:scaffold1996_cov127-Cylindrotheca_fusiformis.AAC.3